MENEQGKSSRVQTRETSLLGERDEMGALRYAVGEIQIIHVRKMGRRLRTSREGT